jgi:hypothetical protein
MTYEKPEVRDFGDIANHTFFQGDDECWSGASGNLCDAVDSTVDG